MTRPVLLIALVLLTLVALVSVVWINRKSEPQVAVADRLLPELQKQLNQVNRLHLVKAGGETVATLKRLDQGWVVANRANYPADVSKIRATLLTLANAELLEQKTANPDYYTRLGLRDINDKDAQGVQLTLDGLDRPVELIVGNQATAGGAFVRRVGDQQSWLASGSLQLPQETVHWLDRAIVDIPPEQLQAIVIRHPDETNLWVEKRTSDQGGFTLVDVPEGRELVSEDAAESLADALMELQLDDVLPMAEKNPAEAEQVVETRYHTFDGYVLTARAFQTDDQNYVHFSVGFDEALAQRFAETSGGEATAADEGEKSAEVAATATTPLDATELAERRQHAEALNAKLSPWVYVIPNYHYELITKTGDDLLKPEETTEETATPREERVKPAAPSKPNPG